jgi:uncharacterized protein Usg
MLFNLKYRNDEFDPAMHDAVGYWRRTLLEFIHRSRHLKQRTISFRSWAAGIEESVVEISRKREHLL